MSNTTCVKLWWMCETRRGDSFCKILKGFNEESNLEDVKRYATERYHGISKHDRNETSEVFICLAPKLSYDDDDILDCPNLNMTDIVIELDG